MTNWGFGLRLYLQRYLHKDNNFLILAGKKCSKILGSKGGNHFFKFGVGGRRGGRTRGRTKALHTMQHWYYIAETIVLSIKDRNANFNKGPVGVGFGQRHSLLCLF